MRVYAVILSLLVVGCAHKSTNQSETKAKTASTQEEAKKKDGDSKLELTAKPPKVASIDPCPDCIVGSSQVSKNSKKRTYFLHGAEHLKLKNYYFDIPVVYNKVTKKWMDYFLGRGRAHFIRYGQRAGRYAPMMSQILDAHDLPRDLIYLAMAESGFHNNAKSWASAVGPWQFMKFTGRRYGLNVDFYRDERRDPFKATVAAARHLRDLFERFKQWELAIAAYNAGEGKISRAMRRYKTKSFWQMSKFRYLARETKNYVPKIMALAILGKNLSTFGFKELDFHQPLDFEEIEVGRSTDLYNVAEILDVDLKEVRKLNPELLRWQTPPAKTSYILRVPVGKRLEWEALSDKERVSVASTAFQKYKIRGKSASLSAVARKFRIPTKALAELNQVSKKKRFKRGQQVKLPFRVGHSRKGKLYADLYERKRSYRSRKRRMAYRRQIRKGLRRGKLIKRPTKFYTVKKGDSLWKVSRKTGVPLNTIIRSNYKLVRNRSLKPGDKLAIQ